MLRKFLNDRRGDYMIATAIAIVPILGGLALAIDYSEMTRQRALTLNALDAAGIAAARFYVAGGTAAGTKLYAKEFFEANMNGIDVSKTVFNVTLPSEETGGGLLTINATHTYKPYFLGAFTSLIGDDQTPVKIEATSQIRLKNTLEVALVLDNSGSMDYNGTGSGKKRITLLKDAAKQLVDTLAKEAAGIKQVEKPLQFSLIPFAASVNVGAANKTASWMDTEGRSPIHHENFDWSTFTSTNKKVTLENGVYKKKGTDWGAEANQVVSRFSLFDDTKRITGSVFVKTGTESYCKEKYWNGSCKTWGTRDVGYDQPTYGAYAAWQGCVETRPYPYNTNDAAPVTGTPATLFVPMFGPDEADSASAENNWWADGQSTSVAAATRQKNMTKYYTPANKSAAGAGEGPNASCTTAAITPLTDVTTTTGKTKINDAIDAMAPLGATNVPEGLAWGWRTVSHGSPFTEGRSETEKGNDKVVIVLTDGANTYYTPGSLGYSDSAGNKSIYSAFGYTAKSQPGESYTRLFMGTSNSVNKSTFDNANYTTALNEQMKKACDNAKAAGVMLMTVSLDLSTTKTDEKKQIEGLTDCASESRFRKDATDPTKPAKLFWNTTGGDLEKTFKAIADELSNLRIVG